MTLRLIATGSTMAERRAERWGLSFLLGEDLLFDAFGKASVFLENMRAMRIDPARIRTVVLSHDDWDHVNGLWEILPGRRDMTVYICPRFSDEVKARIRSSGAAVIEAAGPLEIQKDVWTTGELPGSAPGRAIYEQSLVVRSGQGIAVITGCAHPGILSIARRAADMFNEPPSLLVGGFHLRDASETQVRTIAHGLRSLGVRRVVPLHCTGATASRILREAFPASPHTFLEKSSLEI